MHTIKGITRRYRKNLTLAGRRDFPKQGAFHCRESGNVVKPQDVFPVAGKLSYKGGPAPLVSWKPKPSTVQPVPNLPALNIEPVFKKIVREPKTEGDKRRTDYKPIRNPKAGETVYVKREVAGKQKWVEVNYSDLLNGSTINIAS